MFPSLKLTERSLRFRWLQTSRALSAPQNEPILEYQLEPKSRHRIELEESLKELQREIQEVPIVIAGIKYTTGEQKFQRLPFNHNEKLASFHYANQALVHRAINAAIEARKRWNDIPILERLELFERAASLISGKYRQKLNAATILGQAKTIKQAEIDSAVELVDFLRFNAHYTRHLLDISQPLSPKPKDETNRLLFRPLDGFVASISPFNFTAIGGNLATSPCLFGNTVVWKPSDGSILSNYLVFELLREAGFPDGVINFVPSEGFDFGRIVTSHPKLGGINFTGSLATFRWLWTEVGLNIRKYESFPRLVGECGGKNYHFIHKSADLETVLAKTISSAFEYSGQKCSACSRLYVPDTLWHGSRLKERLVEATKMLKVGPADQFDTFTSAVIDGRSLERIGEYLAYAKYKPEEFNILCGGEIHGDIGYYVEPTIIESRNPRSRLMLEEIFGPILTVYVYPENQTQQTLDLVNDCSYALTGAIFAQDENFIKLATTRLLMSAGNLYINDKSTGAVVGQQPFGGAKLSGTNDKAGGPHYLMRWTNQLTLKRTTRMDLDGHL